MVKEKGYVQQKLHIDGVLAKDIIQAGAFHAKLCGQPRHRAALDSQLFTDTTAYAEFLYRQLQPIVPAERHNVNAVSFLYLSIHFQCV